MQWCHSTHPMGRGRWILSISFRYHCSRFARPQVMFGRLSQQQQHTRTLLMIFEESFLWETQEPGSSATQPINIFKRKPPSCRSCCGHWRSARTVSQIASASTVRSFPLSFHPPLPLPSWRDLLLLFHPERTLLTAFCAGKLCIRITRCLIFPFLLLELITPMKLSCKTADSVQIEPNVCAPGSRITKNEHRQLQSERDGARPCLKRAHTAARAA